VGVCQFCRIVAGPDDLFLRKNAGIATLIRAENELTKEYGKQLTLK
jgi:hypothetical protein